MSTGATIFINQTIEVVIGIFNIVGIFPICLRVKKTQIVYLFTLIRVFNFTCLLPHEQAETYRTPLTCGRIASLVSPISSTETLWTGWMHGLPPMLGDSHIRLPCRHILSHSASSRARNLSTAGPLPWPDSSALAWVFYIINIKDKLMSI